VEPAPTPDITAKRVRLHHFVINERDRERLAWSKQVGGKKLRFSSPPRFLQNVRRFFPPPLVQFSNLCSDKMFVWKSNSIYSNVLRFLSGWSCLTLGATQDKPCRS